MSSCGTSTSIYRFNECKNQEDGKNSEKSNTAKHSIKREIQNLRIGIGIM